MAGGPDLTHHRRHPGFTQDGQGHAQDPLGGNPERGGSQGVDELGQPPPTSRFVPVSRIVGSRAPCAVRIEAQAQVDVGIGGIGGRGPGGTVRVKQRDDLGPGGDEGPAYGGDEGVEPAFLADGDPSSQQRPW